MIRSIILLTTVTVSVSCFATNAVCTLNGQERKVEVVYQADGELPCEVLYTKASGTEVLWRAENERGYCESKATLFVEKLRGWGWQCELTDAAKPESPTELN